MQIEQIFEMIQPVLILLLASLVGVLVGYGIRIIRQALSDQQWQMIEHLIAQAVRAAEQYGGNGEEKKRQALEYAERALAERGIHLDVYALDVAIEAAVWQEINRFRGALESTHAIEPA